MAVLNSDSISPKEKEREASTSKELVRDGVPQIEGITCVRGISPLVMTALHLSDNPYVTGRKGFEAAKIVFAENGEITDFAAFAVKMMPKTAAVLVLWTCNRDALKKYAVDSEALQDAALDYMEDFPGGYEGLAKVTIDVSNALKAVQLSKAVPKDEEPPEASTLSGEGGEGPKEPARTGGHNS